MRHLLTLWIFAAVMSAQNISTAVETHDDFTKCPVDVTFNHEQTPNDKYTPVSFMWDFGDKTRGQGNPIKHRFTGAGPFKVVLVTDDGKGNQRNYRSVIRMKTIVEFPPVQ